MRTRPSRNAAGSSAKVEKKTICSAVVGPKPKASDSTVTKPSVRITAPSSRTGSKPRRWSGLAAWRRRSSVTTVVTSANRNRRPCGTPMIVAIVVVLLDQQRVAVRALRALVDEQRGQLQHARDVRGDHRATRAQRPSTRPVGNASSRWTSAEMQIVSKQRPDREQHRLVEELQRGQRDERRRPAPSARPCGSPGGARARTRRRRRSPTRSRRRCRGSSARRAAGDRRRRSAPGPGARRRSRPTIRQAVVMAQRIVVASLCAWLVLVGTADAKSFRGRA